MLAAFLESAAALLGALTPLVAVPLTVFTFYLRSLREHQLAWHADFIRRLETAEATATDLRKMLRELERDFTTKEEWIRECTQTRRMIERLTRAAATEVRTEAAAGGGSRSVAPDPLPTASASSERAACSPTAAPAAEPGSNRFLRNENTTGQSDAVPSMAKHLQTLESKGKTSPYGP